MSDGADVPMASAAVEYTSLDTAVANVSASGVVTPVAKGTAKINVKVTYDGYSAEKTVEIPITLESLPDGTAFELDLATIDKSTAFSGDGVRFYLKSSTKGANWAIDEANTTNQYYICGTTSAIRAAQPYWSIPTRNNEVNASEHGGVAIKFTVPETGIYNVSAWAGHYSVCGYADIHIIDGGKRTYLGTIDTYDASGDAVTPFEHKLNGIELTGGKEYSIVFSPSGPSGGANSSHYFHKYSFTPVKKAANITGITAGIENTTIVKDTEVEIGLSANTADGRIFFFGKPATAMNVSYETTDASVATAANGKINAVGVGNATITVKATVNGEEFTDTIEVSVIIPEISEIITETIKYILVSDSVGKQLSVSAKMSDDTDVDMQAAEVAFESLDESVATVSADGIVTPVAKGTAQIKVSVTYKGKTVDKTVSIPVTETPIYEKKIVDFKAQKAASVQTSTFDTNGYVLNTTITTPSIKTIRYQPYGIQVSSDINNAVAFDFEIGEAGYYDIEFQGGGYAGGGTANLYIDNKYIGEYCFYDAGNDTLQAEMKRMRSIELSEGVHTLILTATKAGDGKGNGRSANMYPGIIIFTGTGTFSGIKNININTSRNELAAGETEPFTVSVTQNNGAEYSLPVYDRSGALEVGATVISETPEYAVVNGDMIKAVATGNAKLSVAAKIDGVDFESEKIIKVNNLTYDKADVNIDEDAIYIVGGRQTLVSTALLSDGSEILPRDITVSYSSSDESIAKIEDGVLCVLAEGKADITAKVIFNGIEKSVKKTVTVENVKLASIVAETEDYVVSALDADGSQLVVTGLLNNGETVNIADSMFSYESLTPDIVAVDENGVVYYVSRGEGKIRVSVEIEGKAFECEAGAISSSQKTKPTIYTSEMRANALRNASKYDWANSLAQTASSAADKWLENIDTLYDSIPVEGVPRSYSITTLNAPVDMIYTCPYCRTNLQKTHGMYSWVIDPIRNPWKVQCPECKNLFPSNDFESFYKLGITEDGTFDRELALQKNQEIIDAGGEGYLVNKLYPRIGEELGIDAEKAAVWMVDDGFGWSEIDGTYGTKTCPKWAPIALYAHFFWDVNGPTKSFMTRAIMDIRDAYLYTGEEKYGRAGAILLDRIADVYPAFDISKISLNYSHSHGGDYSGKIVGNIWETRLATEFIRAYDAFYPMMEDSQVISYLSKRAAELGLDNPKTSADMIRENAENGIVREAFKAAKTAKINGNFGMHQNTVALAAAALDTQPETNEMISWLGGLSSITTISVTDPIYDKSFRSDIANTGGEMLLKYIADVDRDGFGNEVGLGYNALWLTNGLDVAETLYRYGAESELNLFENPKYRKMFNSFIKLTLGDGYSIQLGDSGGTASKGFVAYPTEMLRAYNMLGDPALAQNYYFYMEGNLDDVYIDIFTDNDGLKAKIQDVIETYGEISLESENLTGFGLAVLRGGELIKGATASTSSEQRYDTWMYYGRVGGHGHYDMLALGVDAYGFNFMPDLGYPEDTGYNPNRWQWANATISHNTVVVNNDSQNSIYGGTPLHYDSTDKVKLIDVEAPSAYSSTDIYRRTAVTVEASSEVAYTLDFFRVKGGDEHTYSFHTQSYMGYTTEDLELVPQKDENGNWVGTYASPEQPYGDDPNTRTDTAAYTTKYPRGYTWLENVNRAENIEDGNFSVNFKATDFNKQVNDSKGLNIKFTALNDWTPSGVGIATGYAPRTSSNKSVKGLDYMLIHRAGSNLDTLYTSLLQPYKGEEYIANATSLSPVIKEGREEENDIVKAVRVELKSGRVDYIIYATNNAVTYTITDDDVSFDFRGFVGVYSVNADKENIYTYINDGDIIGENASTARYTGKVMDFTKELTDENFITVRFDDEADIDNLVGRYIYINNNGKQNGAYRIVSAESAGSNVVIGLGDVSVISGFVDKADLSRGYTYNIAKSQTFAIPLSVIADDAPVFNAVAKDISTSAESAVSVAVNAESPIGKNVVYELRTAPRGASIDPVTGTVTWKPGASQLGESGFVVAAIDEDGRENTTVFEIEVYGSTSGAGSQTPSTPSTPSTPGTSGGSAGGAGGGGGAAPAPSTPSDDKTDDKTDAPSKDDGETEKVRFVDLGAHAWAADAINALADEGIIKGTSEDTFSPAANITRADFALLLVRAFKLESENEENFADVAASDYFAPELAIARNTGLVNGIGDNKFAPKNTITRQDMMTIVYRALQALEVELETGDVEYSDFEAVAEYAKDAVKSLIASGLVNGKGGKIAPTDNTTRAEVAVLIKRILDYTAK
ncbi:MAG: S-layer homology domain-containing protein [Oscillospiraceae bacterium]|nr:S-layer homology domain-containing protein [Oscillospiraceae bacterium]